jgi:hypothetical protein
MPVCNMGWEASEARRQGQARLPPGLASPI